MNKLFLLCFMFVSLLQQMSLCASARDESLLINVQKACTVLGISLTDDVSHKAITKKYRTAAKLVHPDRYEGSKEDAEKLFKEISAAHELLLAHSSLIKEVWYEGPQAGSSWRYFLKPLPEEKNIPVQVWEDVHNACIFLGISSDDERVIQARYELFIKRIHTPDQLLYATAQHARTVLKSHKSAIPEVLTFISLGLKRTAAHIYSRQTVNDAIKIVQDERCIWHPTVDYMRCYQWAGLLTAIKWQKVEDVEQYIKSPNPYLCLVDNASQKNPVLQDVNKRSKCALDAAYLSVQDLLNIHNGSTDALSEAYYCLQDPPLITGDVYPPKERAQKVYDVLVLHGAVARFVKV